MPSTLPEEVQDVLKVNIGLDASVKTALIGLCNTVAHLVPVILHLD